MSKTNHDEAKFHTKLIKFIKHNLHLFPKSFKFETKIVRRGKNTFNFKELSSKEERLLLRAKHRAHVQTHSDYGGCGTDCDGDVISGGGLIFIQWYRYANKEFCVIDIDNFITEKNIIGMKSLTEKRANEIGVKLILERVYTSRFKAFK